MSTEKKSPFLPITAGCIAGGIEATSVWPMEYIKTQLQLNRAPYNGMISGFRYTIKTTGEIKFKNGGFTLYFSQLKFS